MPEPGDIAKQDQALTGVENTAIMVSSYYQDLIKRGIPYTLACKLTVELNRAIWEKTFRA
jgi:monoamine oxidase